MYICSITQPTNRLMSASRSPVRAKRRSNPEKRRKDFRAQKINTFKFIFLITLRQITLQKYYLYQILTETSSDGSGYSRYLGLVSPLEGPDLKFQTFGLVLHLC
jgi:hypothetical protein